MRSLRFVAAESTMKVLTATPLPRFSCFARLVAFLTSFGSNLTNLLGENLLLAEKTTAWPASSWNSVLYRHRG
jgi:hypothetical protein